MANLRQKECKLFNEAHSILEALSEIGFRQHILSAREENELKTEIVSLGISGFFSNVTGLNDHFAHGKSDVGRGLLSAIQVSKENILFVGDTQHDSEVASLLGIDCVLIPNGHHSEERVLGCGVPVVSSLPELLDII